METLVSILLCAARRQRSSVRFTSENSDRLVEGTRNNLTLLLTAQLVEVHRVAGNTDGQVRVLLGCS